MIFISLSILSPVFCAVIGKYLVLNKHVEEIMRSTSLLALFLSNNGITVNPLLRPHTREPALPPFSPHYPCSLFTIYDGFILQNVSNPSFLSIDSTIILVSDLLPYLTSLSLASSYPRNFPHRLQKEVISKIEI
jgi:hypothetical protein